MIKFYFNLFFFKFLLWVVVILLCDSCKPAYDRSCLKKTGSLDSLEIELVPFEKLNLGEHITYILVQDTVDKVVVSGGSNLLNFIDISSESTNSTLTIRNNNRCRFLRYNTSNVLVEIHFNQMREIIFNGSESLSNRGLLEMDNLKLVTLGAAGSISLNLEANEIHCINDFGWPDIEISGKCNIFRAEIYGHQLMDTRQLIVTSHVNVISNAGTKSQINSQGVPLRVELRGTGDLWYYGEPTSIDKKEYNSGRLINKN